MFSAVTDSTVNRDPVSVSARRKASPKVSQSSISTVISPDPWSSLKLSSVVEVTVPVSVSPISGYFRNDSGAIESLDQRFEASRRSHISPTETPLSFVHNQELLC